MPVGKVTAQEQALRPVRKLTLTWESDDAGEVSGERTQGYTWGEIVRVSVCPGQGDRRPRHCYSVELLDDQGIDVLAGRCKKLSGSTPVTFAPAMPFGAADSGQQVPFRLDDRLELRIKGAGANKSGTVVVYTR